MKERGTVLLESCFYKRKECAVMGAHNIPYKLESDQATFSADGRAWWASATGFMIAWGTTVPTTGATGYGKIGRAHV